MNLNKTENTAVLGIFLALTGLIAALLLAFFSDITQKPIAQAAEESANKSLISVMLPFKSKKTVVFKNITFSCVYDEKGILIGVAGETSVKGYGGDIRTLVGMNVDGSIRHVIVLDNNETPGLGSNVCVRKEQKNLKTLFTAEKKDSSLAPNRILDYYSGKKINSDSPWKVAKDGGDCPYITGATVSSRALCEAVYEIVSVYSHNQKAVQELSAKEEK